MTDKCFRTEDLGELSQLASDDARRAHLAECPRCRADLAAYQAFMETVTLPGEADAEDARSRLAAALAEGICPVHAQPAESARAPEARPGRALRAIWRGLTCPALRPAWGLVAVVLLVVAAQQITHFGQRRDEPIVLRGPGSRAGEAVTASWERLADGGVRFTWMRVAGVERYSLALYRSDLSELDRIDAGTEQTLLLDAQAISRLAGTDSVLYWRLIGLRAGEEHARSTLGSLELRR